MKVGHYQCICTPGDLAANTAKVMEGLEYAEAEGIAMMSLPESLLTGYFASAEKARQHSLTADGPEIAGLLERTAGFTATFMVGFNERRGGDLYNTVLVAERGKLLGIYSKAFPCLDYFTPGRDFPVFERDGVTFGVVICADGGYIEPTRILALQGARIVFAPHYNYIAKQGLLAHFTKVRSDHAARAVENGIWFLRGNNVVQGRDEGLERDGVGYGDSYLVDPNGEIVVRSRRHEECFLAADVDVTDEGDPLRRTRESARELGPLLMRMIHDLTGEKEGKTDD